MKYIIILLITILMLSCNTDLNNTKQEVNVIAEKINSDFLSVRSSVNELDKYIERNLESFNPDDYNTNNFLTSDRGNFNVYENVVYYRIPIKEEGCLFATGTPPINDKIIKKMIFLENTALKKIQSVKESNSVLNSSWFFTYDNVSVGYPYYDAVSNIPKEIDLFKLDWAVMGYEKMTWSKDPFVSLSSGWFMTLASPVIVNNKLEGVVTSDVKLKDMNLKYIDKSDSLIMLMSENTTLVGISDKLSDILKTPKLSSYEYLDQLHKNPESKEENKLIHNSRDSGLVLMAENILGGSNDFKISIKDMRFRVTYKIVPEVNFYVIGLSRENK